MIFRSSSSSGSNSLALSGGANSRELSLDLRIIVETNFQVCAYVNSELHLDMLKLFVDVSIRMPNMAFGSITRAKAKKAFSMGITAAQVAEFLTAHAHQSTRENSQIIPSNVTEQLILWEAEMVRIDTDDVTVFGILRIYCIAMII